MFKKPTYNNLIPIRPILNEKMLEYEAANQSLIHRDLLNLKDPSYMIYCYAYSQINTDTEDPNISKEEQEELDEFEASCRVLLASIINNNLNSWNPQEKNTFIKKAKDEFDTINKMQKANKITGGHLERVETIKKVLQERGTYEQVKNEWEKIIKIAYPEMVEIISQEKEDSIPPNEIIWCDIIDKAVSLN